MRINRWDLLGIILSGLCLIHCLLLPVVLTSLPRLASTQEPFHVLIVCLALPIGLWALVPGFGRHRKLWIPILGGLGLAFLVSAALLHELCSENMDRLLTSMGGIMLVTAHLNNARHSRSRCC